MHYSGNELHPDAKARSGMLAELARRWAQRPASEWTDSTRRPAADDVEETEEPTR